MRMKRATLQNEKKKKSINAEIETEKSAKNTISHCTMATNHSIESSRKAKKIKLEWKKKIPPNSEHFAINQTF